MRAARELWSPLGPALALCAAVLFFGSSALPWVGGAAILVAAGYAAFGLPRGLGPLLPLAGLAAWCALSVAWSIEPDRSWDYANRAAVYLAFAFIGAYLAGRTGGLAVGLAAILGAVCAWSLAGKAFPWLYEDYGRIARLRGPVGYWNALALLGDLALPLGLWLATRRRLWGTLLVYGWIVAIVLTYSRGGIAVALIVVAAWLVWSGFWLDGLATLVAAGLPAAAVLGLALVLPGITDDGASHAARVHDGLWFLAGLVVGGVVAGALAGLPPPQATLAVRRMAALLVLVVAVVLCIGAGFRAHAWWNEFTAPASSEVSNTPGRLTEASSNHRWLWWQQAWHGFEQDRLKGTGAGSFEFTNLRYRESTLDTALEPHSLPVQFLSETGLVGLVLFLLAGLALVRAARTPTDPEVALALFLPAYLLHGLIDIDWDFAAVSAPVFLVAGALAAKPVRRFQFSFPRALVAAGVGLFALSSLGAVWLGGRWSGQAFDALGSDPAHAVALAKKARSVQPLSVDPLYYEALAEQVQGPAHYGETLGLLQKATKLQPDNAETWYRLGEFNLRVRLCPRTALPELDRYTALNPKDPGNKEYDLALRQVNSGLPTC